MRAKHAREIRQGIKRARTSTQPPAPLGALAYRAFRRENLRRVERLLRRLRVMQVESATKIVMLEAAETIRAEWRKS
jgi:hypothetical protein